MIQRIQTLFLLASTLMLSALFFAPMEIASLVFTIITTAISFISIFLYKHRPVQIKLSSLNIIILLVFQALLLYYFYSAPEKEALSVNVFIPVIAAVFTFLARIYISKDEALVKSTSRLR